MIVTYPAAILNQMCEPVVAFDDKLAELVADLHRALELSEKQGRPGFALSACQIGVPLRVFIAEGWPDPFVNPEMTQHSNERAWAQEGSVSVLPWGTTYTVRRYKTCRTVAANLAGERRTRKHRGLDARIVQHQLDHLDGFTIVDRANEQGSVRVA